MIPIYRAACIHIEVTNACNLSCSQCTRGVDVNKSDCIKPYFMPLKKIEKALKSLKGYRGTIGIMGGEPTMHPQFKEICWLMQEVPEKQRGLWTNGYNYNKYRTQIDSTFLKENIVYNDHKDDKDTDQHQVINLKSKDIVKDEFLLGLLIANCWVQWRWSASINPNGAFFCEIAAARALRKGIKGYKVEPFWWDKDPNEFLDQVLKFCRDCSACVPMKPISSKGGVVKLPESINTWHVLREVSKGWRPYCHRKISKMGDNQVE